MATFQNIGPRLQAKLTKSLSILPTVLGNEAVNWTKDNFRRQGYPGNGFQAWKARSSNAKRNSGRALLIDSGRLSRSPRIMNTGPLQVDIGTDVPYARAHNQGVNTVVTVKSYQRNKFGTVKLSTGKTGQFRTKKSIVGKGTVKSHQRRMNLPKRQFIGASPVLASILRRKAIIHIGRELKN